MSELPQVLLINPTITARRSARFPLAVMSLARALEGRYVATVLDGNIDRDFVATAQRLVRERRFAAVGVTIMGGPQLRSGIAVSKGIRAAAPQAPDRMGRCVSRPTVRRPRSTWITSTMQSVDKAKIPLPSCSAPWRNRACLRFRQYSGPELAQRRADRPQQAAAHSPPRALPTGCRTSSSQIRSSICRTPTLGAARPVIRPRWAAGSAARSVGWRRCIAARWHCPAARDSRKTSGC